MCRNAASDQQYGVFHNATAMPRRSLWAACGTRHSKLVASHKEYRFPRVLVWRGSCLRRLPPSLWTGKRARVSHALPISPGYISVAVALQPNATSLGGIYLDDGCL